MRPGIFGLGESLRFGRYDLKLLSVNDGETGDYQFSHAVIQVSGMAGKSISLSPK